MLYPKHRFTELLTDHKNQEARHNGQETVASNIRQNFWSLCSEKIVEQLLNLQKITNLNKNTRDGSITRGAPF